MSEKIEIIVLGDICPTEDYRPLFNMVDNPKVLLSDIVDDLYACDLAIANLECPATTVESPITKTGPNLKALPKDLTLLKNAGIDCLSLANNHILDYGYKGVLETLKFCKELKIQTVGGGKDLESAKQPKFIKVKGKKIGILSFAEEEFNIASESTPGANFFDSYESSDDIRIARQQCDFLIILYHGGIEHYVYPSPLLQKKCRKMVDWGADIVLCQHSHCIGTIENYKSSTIVYGQGNTVFGYRESDPTWNEGLAVRITIENDKPKIDFTLLKADKNGVKKASTLETENRIREIREVSSVIANPEQIQNLWKQFTLDKAAMYYPMLFGKGRIFNKVNRTLNNLPIKSLVSNRKMMITMNLIRCDAHKEVVQTILQENYKNYYHY